MIDSGFATLVCGVLLALLGLAGTAPALVLLSGSRSASRRRWVSLLLLAPPTVVTLLLVACHSTDAFIPLSRMAFWYTAVGAPAYGYLQFFWGCLALAVGPWLVIEHFVRILDRKKQRALLL